MPSRRIPLKTQNVDVLYLGSEKNEPIKPSFLAREAVCEVHNLILFPYR